jgi:hypothetical protein
MNELPSKTGSEPRRWTLEGGIRKHTRAGDVRDTLIWGPVLELREDIEVMPVSEHELLREAAQAVVETEEHVDLSGASQECINFMKAIWALRAVLSPATTTEEEN